MERNSSESKYFCQCGTMNRSGDHTVSTPDPVSLEVLLTSMCIISWTNLLVGIINFSKQHFFMISQLFFVNSVRMYEEIGSWITTFFQSWMKLTSDDMMLFHNRSVLIELFFCYCLKSSFVPVARTKKICQIITIDLPNRAPKQFDLFRSNGHKTQMSKRRRSDTDISTKKNHQQRKS